MLYGIGFVVGLLLAVIGVNEKNYYVSTLLVGLGVCLAVVSPILAWIHYS